MREYEIRLLGPSGRVAEVYIMGAASDACALMRARILIQSHPEFASAKVRENYRVLDADIRGQSYIQKDVGDQLRQWLPDARTLTRDRMQ